MNLSLGFLSLNLPNGAPVLITILKVVSGAGWPWGYTPGQRVLRCLTRILHLHYFWVLLT